MANNDELIERADKAQKMVPRVIDVFEPAVFIGSVIDDLATALRAADQRIAELERENDGLRAVRQSLHQAMMLQWRGIGPGCECSLCGGAGLRAYSSTATWRGGFGGQAFTNDVCDACWGSGDSTNKWPSHRLLDAAMTSERATDEEERDISDAIRCERENDRPARSPRRRSAMAGERGE